MRLEQRLRTSVTHSVVYHLQEVEITEFRGSEHEVTFVKQTIQMGDGANKYDSNFQFFGD
jgi:hypothetical protein